MIEETTTTNDASIDESSGDNNGDEWMELMGKDLMMKIIGKEEVGESSDIIDPPTIISSTKEGQPEVGDAVYIDYSGYCCNESDEDEAALLAKIIVAKKDHSSVVTPVVEASGLLIILGDGDVPPGLEMAVRFLLPHQVAIVKCHSKYAYGPNGRRRSTGHDDDYSISPYANVIYRLHVRSIVSSTENIQFDTHSFRWKRALAKKQIGNDCYQHEWSESAGKGKALKLYGKASEDMVALVNEIRQERTDDEESSHEKEKESLSILLDCLNNIAAVHLRAKSYGLAKEAAANVLQYDPDNMKALCRAARASMLDPAGTYEESDMAICSAEQIDGNNKEVQKLRAELDWRKKEYKRKEKDMYSKMMKGTGCKDSTRDGEPDIKTKNGTPASSSCTPKLKQPKDDNDIVIEDNEPSNAINESLLPRPVSPPDALKTATRTRPSIIIVLLVTLFLFLLACRYIIPFFVQSYSERTL